MPYRRPTALVLSEAERGELEAWARRRRTAQALALRARIVLRSGDGLSNTAIARELKIAKHTVGKWRERFARLRSDGLLDEPRPGAPRRIGDEEIAALVDRTALHAIARQSKWKRHDNQEEDLGIAARACLSWRDDIASPFLIVVARRSRACFDGRT